MKFNENVATVEGNAIFEETVKMSFESDSMPFLIKSLTEMYSNPVLALSREYISNAYDATVARMGSQSSFGTVLDTPIEVTLPSSLNPNFVIRDYGVGMNRDVLANVFPKYGASTKRDNNTEIGGFGLGAKSALAVVANFTVVSIKDGKKNTAIIQKGADGVGEVSFLPELATEEPSGTTVTITLPKPSELNMVFRDSSLLLGFPHGSILLNGKMHENSVHNPALYTQVGEDGWIQNSLLDWENSENYRYNNVGGRHGVKNVVVGPISYTVKVTDVFGSDYSSEELNSVFDAASTYSVLNLPIGSVDFTPARENLIFSERTIKTILDASRRHSKAVQKFVQESISEAPNKMEAARRADILRLNNFTLDWTYKGEVIPKLELSAFRVEGKEAWVADRNHKVTPRKDDLNYAHGKTSRTVIVTGVENAEQAKVLNRLRKPFADRHAPSKINTENLIVLYTQAEKSELTSWADAMVMDVFTPEEWEAKGVAYRKEINEERKAARGSTATGVVNHGSLPVTVIEPAYNHHERPKAYSTFAAHVSKADTVIYFRINNDAPTTLSHKMAKTMSADGELSVKAMNFALDAIRNHYSEENKVTNVVRVPASTKLETFLKAVPHAISVDEAFKSASKEINKDAEGDALAMLIARGSYRYAWVESMTSTTTELVVNDEVRAFLESANKAYVKAHNRKTSRAISAKSSLIFSTEFGSVFEGFRKTVETADKFPLPLLEVVGSRYGAREHVVQYINLMYPAVAVEKAA
jgi:hypothetical protein